MKEKGFTLVELIAVIALIALLSTIIIINMTGVQTDSIEVEIKKFNEKVSDAGCNYIDMGKELKLTTGASCSNEEVLSNRDACKNIGCYVCLKTIIEEGLIDRDIIDPYNNKKVTEENEDIMVHIFWKEKNGKKEKVCEFIRNKEEITPIIIESYKITLHTNGGKINKGAINEYTKGIGATLPTDVSRLGYSFDGWYTGDNGTGSKVSFVGPTESGDKVFYAKWIANSYTINLIPNGGVINSGNVTGYSYGNNIPLPGKNNQSDVTKLGYNFAGWYDNIGLLGTKIEEIKPTDKGNKVFWAKWSIKTDVPYKVIHWIQKPTGIVYQQDATNYDKYMEETFQGTTNETIMPLVKNINGYTSPSTQTTTISADGTTVVNYYYPRNSYSVTFDTNYGIIRSGRINSYTFGVGATLPNDVIRDGHSFEGWYDNSSLSGSPITNITTTDSGNKTYWAKWSTNQYRLTYDNQGGTGCTYKTADYGSQWGDLCAPNRTNYVFRYWYTEPNGGGSRVYKTDIVDGNKTIYAKWIARSYTITYNSNGGQINGEYTTSYQYGTGVTLPTNVEKEGYTFAGWYDNASLSGAPILAISSTSSGNKAYWAKWAPKTYTLTYNSDGGTQCNPPTVSRLYGSTWGPLSCRPTKTGYIFEHWTVSDSDIVTKDENAYASWNLKSYKITFLNVNNEVICTSTIGYGGERLMYLPGTSSGSVVVLQSFTCSNGYTVLSDIGGEVPQWTAVRNNNNDSDTTCKVIYKCKSGCVSAIPVATGGDCGSVFN